MTNILRIIISQVKKNGNNSIIDIRIKFLKINSGKYPLFRPKLKVIVTSELILMAD